MLGYEPPKPSFLKALIGAGIVTFPVLYIADVAIFRHQPGWIYLCASLAISLLIAYQMYSSGPESLRPIGLFRRSSGVAPQARSLIPKRGPADPRD